jgi:hypothetical protein
VRHGGQKGGGGLGSRCGHLACLAQGGLDPLARRDVPQHAREEFFVPRLSQRERHLQGDVPAVCGAARQRDVVPARELALARRQIALQPGGVRVAELGGHERGQGLAEPLRCGGAERLLRRAVELADTPVLIKGDDRIGRGVENVAGFLLARPQGVFHPLARRDFALQPAGPRRQIRRAAAQPADHQGQAGEPRPGHAGQQGQGAPQPTLGLHHGRLQGENDLQDAAHVARVPVGLGTGGMRVVALDATGTQEIRRRIAQGRAAVDLFKPVKGAGAGRLSWTPHAPCARPCARYL